MSSAALALRTRGPDDTRALAAAAAPWLRSGDVVALTGELGAGKTCFVQGAAAALGVQTPVTSPTFTLVRTYPAAVPVVHLDVYRLDRLQDVLELGEDEVMAADAITFIEWGDAITPLLPRDHLTVELLLGDDDDERRLLMTAAGTWVQRLAEAAPALDRWRERSGAAC